MAAPFLGACGEPANDPHHRASFPQDGQGDRAGKHWPAKAAGESLCAVCEGSTDQSHAGKCAVIY